MFKNVENGYITSIYEGMIGNNLVDQFETEKIRQALTNRPVVEGFYVKLKNESLEWELVPLPDEEATDV